MAQSEAVAGVQRAAPGPAAVVRVLDHKDLSRSRLMIWLHIHVVLLR